MDEREERHRLRATFGRIADQYERARPSYPEIVFDDILELGRVPAGGRVLELGCGTGQATLPFARRRLHVVCVELEESLASATRAKTAAFPNVEVVTSSFEAWPLPPAPFDLATAFTAFHWIDPEARYAKTSQALRDGGALAVVETAHVNNEDSFWDEVQADYDAIVPHPDNRPPPQPEDVADEVAAEIDSTGLFRTVGVRRRLWDVTYTADEYIAVIGTYSRNLVLDPSTRRRLFERIHRRIEERGTVTKTYLAHVTVARRV